ncbi:very-long-chain (3R)-3-hydroxyacyl-CoA dehydratase-like [Liolophura sinensis]|uniref:very-long-chain (3R)-3-hydroxyacyl-CoA dehydratase-like n=1 Tax=Liolophura sinensis TaxID=3198878 RepID=UPI00315876E7
MPNKMADSLSPFVYWGQKKDHISLKIDLKEAIIETLDITEDKVRFVSQGLGVRGTNKYEFELSFYHPVDSENSKYRVTDRDVLIHIQKKGVGEIWPRLTEKPVKLPWLKIDFDNFGFEDESGDEESENEEGREMMKKFEKHMKSKEASSLPEISVGYMFFYNMFQFVGFLYIFVILQYKYITLGEEAKKSALEFVGLQIMLCQLVSMLEVFHPILGLVKTGFFTPFLQVTGRNFILFIVILQEPRLQDAPVIWYLFVVWSSIEIVRYPYYMLKCINLEIRLITWLRYSLWIPLYPIGFLMEGTVIIMAMPLYEDTGKFSFNLPNFANMPFSFPFYLRLHLALLALAGYFLLNHMYRQRKKRLYRSDPSPKKKAKKTN